MPKGSVAPTPLPPRIRMWEVRTSEHVAEVYSVSRLVAPADGWVASKAAVWPVVVVKV